MQHPLLAVDWAAFGVALAALVATIVLAVVEYFTNKERDRKGTERDAQLDELRRAQTTAPGGAKILDVAQVDGAQKDVHPAEIIPEGTAELLPGEMISGRLYATFGTHWPVKVHVRWLDGTGNVRERIRELSPPP